MTINPFTAYQHDLEALRKRASDDLDKQGIVLVEAAICICRGLMLMATRLEGIHNAFTRAIEETQRDL